MDILEQLISRYPVLEKQKEAINQAYCILADSYSAQGKLLIAGNGGSCADADHIVGELMKGFKKRRPISDELRIKLESLDSLNGGRLASALQCGLPAIALGEHSALNSAFINDVQGGGEFFYAQQVLGYGVSGDVFLGITTSGNSKDVVYAAVTAKAKGMKVIALTGKGGGKMAALADCLIAVDETETFKVQELHLPIYHALCLMLENKFFAE